MSRRLRWVVVVLAALPGSAFAESYYVDCSRAGQGRGTLERPWTTLATVSTRTFRPGDVIAFKRGTTCPGMLAPKGSGAVGAPISIGAYDIGPRPVIDAGASVAAIQLFNQSYWAIRDIETTGGTPHGIHISGNVAATLTYFRIANVSVHDVGGMPTTRQSGLIDISPESGSSTLIDDVIVDGAIVYNTEQWSGIHVGCIDGIVPAPNAGAIIIRNSQASNTGGDGITIYACSHGLIENNVAYEVGNLASTALGSPNAIWTWACAGCTVQFNEGYRSHSPLRDGGIFDIDWASSNTTVQYNYGHDADGYCVSIFGNGDLPTTNSVVRYNICSNNGRSDPHAQGDIYLKTWRGGVIDGCEIYNNTVYWNPSASFAAISNRGNALGARPCFFKNNIVYSTGAPFMSSDGNLTADHNLYWSLSAPRWDYAHGSWTSFASFQAETGQEPRGRFADPLLADVTQPVVPPSATAFKLRAASPAIDRGVSIASMPDRDFFGVAVPQGAGVDIGASEYAVAPNLIVNASFEMDRSGAQTPSGWNSWSLAGNYAADYSERTGSARAGKVHGTHRLDAAPYDVFTYQVVPDLALDTYQLTAWVKSSGGQRVAWVEVNAYGGVKRMVPIPASPTWTRVVVSDILVTTGRARIGFYSIADAGQWIAFDDVRFRRQSPDASVRLID